ncbi:glycosyltransferase family 4 protein [Silicimonas sp. MF1-12-2]|uniref:glycosyltransferase family 4 protein n=1 Tax=Silicimonas sp. MF1-12-2 TaxID=3384793 RepID=UPI0039B389E7
MGHETEPRPLIVALARHYGGVDVRVRDTARFLTKEGWTYGVATLRDSPLHKALQAEKLSVYPLDHARGDPRISMELIRVGRSIGANILDAHNMQSQYWGALAAVRGGIRGRLASVHSIYRDIHKTQPRRAIHEGALQICRTAGFHFLAVSPLVASYLEEFKIPPAHLHTILNGMPDLEAAPVRLDIRGQHGWPRESFLVAAIGRLEKEKGLQSLVKAIGLVRDRGRCDVRLLVIGRGRQEAELIDMVSAGQLGNHIQFLGFRSDTEALLASVDAVCMPSLTEGMPYTAMEACRQGVPSICSRVGGLARMLEDRRTTLFVPPSDPARLADALTELCGDEALRHTLSLEGRALFESDFRVERMTRETAKLYMNLVS